MQAAVRYEDYGQDGGGSRSTPKWLRWELTDWLTARGSIGTTFRGPPQSFLSGEVTTLGFVVPTGVFKAVVPAATRISSRNGNTSSVGVIVKAGGSPITRLLGLQLLRSVPTRARTSW